MKNIRTLKSCAVFAAALLCLSTVSAGRGMISGSGGVKSVGPTKKTTVSGEYYDYLNRNSKSNLSGQLRRLEETLDDIDKKLLNSKADTRKRMDLLHRREKVALQLIHESQKYMLNEKRNRLDDRSRRIHNILVRESEIIGKRVKGLKDFPYPDKLDSMMETLVKIRDGKIKYFNRRVPRSLNAILNDIQDAQYKALEKFHKEEFRNRR